MIAHQLSERGLQACQENSRVLIAVNLQQDDEWQSKIPRLTNIDLQRSGDPQVTITFLPEVRLRNLLVGSSFPFWQAQLLDRIRTTLREAGAIYLTLEKEIELASSICPDDPMVESLGTRMLEQRTHKERFVTEQEFEKAAMARDKEDELAQELENYLRRHKH